MNAKVLLLISDFQQEDIRIKKLNFGLSKISPCFNKGNNDRQQIDFVLNIIKNAFNSAWKLTEEYNFKALNISSPLAFYKSAISINKKVNEFMRRWRNKLTVGSLTISQEFESPKQAAFPEVWNDERLKAGK